LIKIKVELTKSKAFTIIEILISMLILFTTVVFVNMTIKAYNGFQRKSIKYQNFYTTTLSIKDWLYEQDFTKSTYRGEMNGLSFEAKITLVLQKKNYLFSLEGYSGNIGNYMIRLYEVELTLKDAQREKHFNYFVTKQKALVSSDQEKFF